VSVESIVKVQAINQYLGLANMRRIVKDSKIRQYL